MCARSTPRVPEFDRPISRCAGELKLLYRVEKYFLDISCMSIKLHLALRLVTLRIPYADRLVIAAGCNLRSGGVPCYAAVSGGCQGGFRAVRSPTYTGGIVDLTGGSAYCCVFKALKRTEKRSRATTRLWLMGAMISARGGGMIAVART